MALALVSALLAATASAAYQIQSALAVRSAAAELAATFFRARAYALVRGVTVSITLLAYCLWAFEKATVAGLWVPWFELSIVPFTALLLRYALAHESSALAGPEDIVLGDRQLQVIGLVWVACLALGVYVADAPPLPG